MLDPRRPFGQPFEDAELIGDLVQQAKAAPDHVGRDLAADAQDRRVGGVSGGQRRRGVEQPRPRHHRIGPDLAARPRIAERHIGSTLLVPGMDHPQPLAGIVEGDEQRVVLHPRQGEDRVHPVPAQHLDHCRAARHPGHCHPSQRLFRHPRESGNPGPSALRAWAPACAGVTTGLVAPADHCSNS